MDTLHRQINHRALDHSGPNPRREPAQMKPLIDYMRTTRWAPVEMLSEKYGMEPGTILAEINRAVETGKLEAVRLDRDIITVDA